MIDKGRISSVEELEKLKGQYICLVMGAPHIIDASELLKQIGLGEHIIIWKVGDISFADENDQTRHGVGWSEDHPDLGFSLKDFGVIGNDYNNHSAWPCPKDQENSFPDAISYDQFLIPREAFDRFTNR